MLIAHKIVINSSLKGQKDIRKKKNKNAYECTIKGSSRSCTERLNEINVVLEKRKLAVGGTETRIIEKNMDQRNQIPDIGVKKK